MSNSPALAAAPVAVRSAFRSGGLRGVLVRPSRRLPRPGRPLLFAVSVPVFGAVPFGGVSSLAAGLPAVAVAWPVAGVRSVPAVARAAWQNGYAERIIRTIKEEEIDLADYQDLADAYARVPPGRGYFIEQVYRHKRIHSSLGYLTPAKFEADWWRQHPSPSLTVV